MFSLNDIVVTDVVSAFTVFSPKGRRATINKRKYFALFRYIFRENRHNAIKRRRLQSYQS